MGTSDPREAFPDGHRLLVALAFETGGSGPPRPLPAVPAQHPPGSVCCPPLDVAALASTPRAFRFDLQGRLDVGLTSVRKVEAPE